jgi:hypothetical protein
MSQVSHMRFTGYMVANNCIPGKYWLVYVGLLAVHLFKVSFIFFRDGLPAAAK